MAWDHKVPFHKKTGDLMHYAEADGYYGKDAIWKPVYEFDSEFEFQHFERGRSAVFAWMKDTDDGRSYPLSLSELAPFIPKLVKGRIHGKWTFKKQGLNFFVTPVKVNP